MKRLKVIIERAKDGTYSAYCEKEPFSGMGDTADNAKDDLLQQIEIYKNYCKEENREYPAYLDDDFELSIKFDTESLLQYYAGIITPTALERLTGIHRKQIWSYMHGKSKPRKPQIEKISAALHKLGQELVRVEL